MPRLSLAVRKYRHYRPKNLAVVNFGRGRDVYLGPWKSQRSRQLCDQLITLWLQHGRTLPDDVLANFCTDDREMHVHLNVAPSSTAPVPPRSPAATAEPAITLRQLADQFNAHATVYYRKHGRSTREAGAIKKALAVAVQVFGKEPASQFGPLKFQLVRDAMVAKGWSRSYINKQCGRIKRAFRWGVTRELVTSAFCGALREVEGLKKGRTTAPETEDVQPVARGVVEATLPFLSSVVADMVSLQLETGARPGEVRALRPCDVDRTGAVWEYRPREHKTEHQDKDRVIFIGPQGQAILRPYLLRAATDYCFSPVDAVRQMRERREASRQTPMSCGNAKGSNRKSVPTGRAQRVGTESQPPPDFGQRIQFILADVPVQ